MTSSGGNVTIDGGLTVTANSITKNGAQVATEAYADGAAGIQTNDSPTLTGNWSWDDDKGLLFGTGGGGPKVYAAPVGGNFHDLMIDLVAGADMVIRDTTGTDILKLLTNGSGGVFSGSWSFSKDVADVINFTANSTNDSRGIAFNNRTALSADYNDGWLRINNTSEFANGTFSPNHIRTGGVFLVDADRGITDPTGSYGTVQTVGGGVGGWEGYNINGNAIFMSNSTQYGLYDDTNNEWGILCFRNGATVLYHNGLEKLESVPGGVNITGAVVATSTMTATNFIHTSDKRLKDEIKPLRESFISNLKPKSFMIQGRKQYGFIAQEVRKFAPELVYEDYKGFLSMDYNSIIAHLVKEVQDLKKQLNG